MLLVQGLSCDVVLLVQGLSVLLVQGLSCDVVRGVIGLWSWSKVLSCHVVRVFEYPFTNIAAIDLEIPPTPPPPRAAPPRPHTQSLFTGCRCAHNPQGRLADPPLENWRESEHAVAGAGSGGRLGQGLESCARRWALAFRIARPGFGFQVSGWVAGPL